MGRAAAATWGGGGGSGEGRWVEVVVSGEALPLADGGVAGFVEGEEEGGGGEVVC